ncbi:hypothetical protein BD414DRAFT_480609 [Trametes punicea]|nr:hypothetical protein BD414DRAFT_480609 [Trametes punicea]
MSGPGGRGLPFRQRREGMRRERTGGRPTSRSPPGAAREFATAKGPREGHGPCPCSPVTSDVENPNERRAHSGDGDALNFPCLFAFSLERPRTAARLDALKLTPSSPVDVGSLTWLKLSCFFIFSASGSELTLAREVPCASACYRPNPLDTVITLCPRMPRTRDTLHLQPGMSVTYHLIDRPVLSLSPVSLGHPYSLNAGGAENLA